MRSSDPPDEWFPQPFECRCGSDRRHRPGAETAAAEAEAAVPVRVLRPAAEETTAAQDVIELASGMVRSDAAGKPDYTLLPLDFLERWAAHMTANVGSKGRDNWRLASTREDLDRFQASAWRHFVAVMRGDTDEDHAAALVFNVAGLEYVRARLS